MAAGLTYGIPGTATYSVTLSGLDEIMSTIPDNTINQITARNLRDVVFTVYETIMSSTSSFQGGTPSLDSVTLAGNTTSNSIQVGGLSVIGTASLNNLILNSTLTDIFGLTGPSGYILSSSDNGVRWIAGVTNSIPSLNDILLAGNVTSNGMQIGGLTISGTASLNNLILNSTLTDISGLTGVDGYILSSTNGGVKWILNNATSSSSSGISVSLPLSGNGVTQSLSLKYNSDFILDIQSNLSLNLDFTSLPALTIVRLWTINKADGTPFPTTSIGNGGSTITVGPSANTQQVTIPSGCKVNYHGTASIGSIGVGVQAPTLVTGNWTFSPNPPTSFPSSSLLSTTSVTTNTTYTIGISKPKSGLAVSGSQVVRASGSDSSSSSDTLTFNDIFYWGYTSVLGSGNINQATVDTLTSADIQALTTYRFGGKAQTLSNVTDSSGNRVLIAYLASSGNISNIILNSSISITTAFIKRTSDLTINTITGLTASYRVYVASADNSYPGANTLLIS